MSLLAKIYKVISIEISRENNGKQNVISTGKTRTLSDGNGTLIPVSQDEANGNFEFDFVANSSSAGIGDALDDIRATYVFPTEASIKSVTINTEENTLQWINNSENEDPYQSDRYIEAVAGTNGIVGIESSGKLATISELYKSSLSHSRQRKATKMRVLSRSEIGKLFDEDITRLIEQTNTGGEVPTGTFKGVTLVKGGKTYAVIWANDVDAPTALVEFHKYLSDLH